MSVTYIDLLENAYTYECKDTTITRNQSEQSADFLGTQKPLKLFREFSKQQIDY